MGSSAEKRKVLIISPHFPPSNLTAVHRSRLFAQHLPSFNWDPIILTVHENYYEEKLDFNLVKLLPRELRIEKVKAWNVTKPRVIGDIGIRGFFSIYRKAKQLIRQERIDFLFIPIPSFYAALLGRLLHSSTGVKYGIDYIDPWVHEFAGSDKVFSRHWWSTKLSAFLEPIAVKKASLISGVAEGYYKGVLERNRNLAATCIFCAMPYGGEQADHEKVSKMNLQPYLFKKKTDKIQMVYAGAMLPNAYKPLEAIFEAIASNRYFFKDLEIHFIGTGRLANDPSSFTIRPYAEKYGLWNEVIFEYAQRIPYLDVLVHLDNASGVFILGSTEPHYTPSKVYQAVLAGKPIYAVLHAQSTAIEVVREANIGIVLPFDGLNGLEMIKKEFAGKYGDFVTFMKSFEAAQINSQAFRKYSAESVTKVLASHLDEIFS